MQYILFSTTTHIFSKIIQFATWSEFSHVEIVTKQNTLIGADAMKGVIESNLQSRLLHSSKVFLCGIDTNSLGLELYCRNRLGSEYDWTGIFGFLFKRNWHEDKKWFCSEIIASGSKDGLDIPLVDEESNRITPRDLLISPKLMKISTNKQEILNLLK